MPMFRFTWGRSGKWMVHLISKVSHKRRRSGRNWMHGAMVTLTKWPMLLWDASQCWEGDQMSRSCGGPESVEAARKSLHLGEHQQSADHSEHHETNGRVKLDTYPCQNDFWMQRPWWSWLYSACSLIDLDTCLHLVEMGRIWACQSDGLIEGDQPPPCVPIVQSPGAFKFLQGNRNFCGLGTKSACHSVITCRSAPLGRGRIAIQTQEVCMARGTLVEWLGRISFLNCRFYWHDFWGFGSGSFVCRLRSCLYR